MESARIPGPCAAPQPGLCFNSSHMTGDHDGPQAKRLSLYQRFLRGRDWVWAILTDEAVLVYRRSAHGKKRARVMSVEFFLFIREIVHEFYSVQGTARAAALAYTTLLSLVPLFVAFSQVLRSYFSKIFPDFQTQVDTILNVIVPYQSAQISYHLNRFAENAQTASTFGAIAFLVVSFRLFMAVESTVNVIWHVPSARGYRQKIRAFTMLLFWGPILFGLSFTTSASLQRNEYLYFFVQNQVILNLVPVFVLFVAFTMLFWLVPSTRVNLGAATLGAAVTTILFQLIRYGFGLYAQHLFTGRLNVIYGTLGLVIIFLLALEVMWVVILLGVEISHVWQNLRGILRASEQQIEADRSFDLYFAIRAMVEIAHRFDLREEAPSSYRLAQEFGATDRQMLEIIRRLEDAQLVKEIGGDWAGFVPGGDPDRINIDEVIGCIEGGGRAIPPTAPDGREKEAIAEVFGTLRECVRVAMEYSTIGHLVRAIYGPPQPSRSGDQPKAQ